MASLCRNMMQLPAEYIATECVPVTLRIREMQVPRLIDLVRGRNFVSGDHGQKQESPILVYHAKGVGMRPTVFACKPGTERQSVARFIKMKIANTLPQLSMQSVHR